MDLYRGLAEGRIPVTEALARVGRHLHALRHLRRSVPLRHGHAADRGHAGAQGLCRGPSRARRARSSGRPRTSACGGSGRSSAGTGRPTTRPSSGLTPTTPSRSPARRCPATSSCPAPGTRSRRSSAWPTSSACPSPSAATAAASSASSSSDGIVLDMNRMRRIEFDLENWCAAVEPGVTSFELQQEAYRRGLRVNAAEPAATVCGNHRLHGDVLDLVERLRHGRGQLRRHGVRRPRRPHLPAQRQERPEPFRLRAPGRALPRHLHQGLGQAPPDDRRRGGRCSSPSRASTRPSASPGSSGRGGSGWPWPSSAPIIIATFLTPDEGLAGRVKAALPEALGINYVVFTIADRFGRDAIRQDGPGRHRCRPSCDS